MNTKPNDPGRGLDDAIRLIRDEQAPEAEAQAAAARVLARLSTGESNAEPAVERIRGCEDVRSLLPAFRAGRLSQARALLVEDHCRECVACRKVLEGRTDPLPWRPLAARPVWRGWAWAAAACSVVAAGLLSWQVFERAPVPDRAQVALQSVNGEMVRVARTGGEALRTPRDAAGTVMLADGSLVEVRERSEFHVTATRRDITIHLDRGSIIVTAAKRRSGHLYVATPDCSVAVTGTVFAVDSGLKGSRVSVIEGEVRVARQGQEQLLRPGDQYASNSSLSTRPVSEEIAWSANADKHLALLKEVSALRRQLESVRLPGLRYSSRLLDYVPQDTVVFASIPNLGQTIDEARRILNDRLRDSDTLRQWWTERAGAGGPEKFDEMIGKIRTLSDYLGEEIVIAVPMEASGKCGEPILMAETKRPGLREFVESELAKAREDGSRQGMPGFRQQGNVVAVGDEAALAAFGAGGFARTGFGSRIAAHYRDGAGLLICADLARIRPNRQKELDAWTRMGLSDLRDVVFEQRQVAGRTENRAAVTFDGARRGIASWLATPAPMGSLDFVGPDASLAAAFVVKNPAQVFDDILQFADAPHVARDLAEFEAKTGIHLRSDLAAPLGGEFTVALDGGLLPITGWKVIVEVNDPARLQQTVERAIEAANRIGGGKPRLALDRTDEGGRAFYTLHVTTDKATIDIQYLFADGYLIVGATRQSLQQAIEYRATGATLTRSPGFTSLLPRDAQPNFSAMVFWNAGKALGPVMDILGAVELSPDQKAEAQAVIGEARPALVYAYGETDRIVLATGGDFLGLTPAHLMGVGKPFGLPRHGKRGTGARDRSYKQMK